MNKEKASFSDDMGENYALYDLEQGRDEANAPLIMEFPSQDRRIVLGVKSEHRYCSNFVSNAKYNAVTFFPVCLFNQFKFFFNLYFLLVALSQIIPALRIGYLSAYIVPLAFVLAITLGKEAKDDMIRRRRDKDANSCYYETLGKGEIQSKYLQVGDQIILRRNMRVPADCLLLKTEDQQAFIRTDQLDGESDWKLRLPCTFTQNIDSDNLKYRQVVIECEKPHKDLNKFYGTASNDGRTIPLSIENVLWANSVLASNSAVCVVVYTGKETRQALNSIDPRNKVGILEIEVNFLSKILLAIAFGLSFCLVFKTVYNERWWISLFRYLILFSTIIPVSLRVNLDLAKLVYSSKMNKDEAIPGTIVRSTNIPEELGRIGFILTDKTGTLTRNEMELKKMVVNQVLYKNDDLDSLRSKIENNSFDHNEKKLEDTIYALSICHNVTPIKDFEADLDDYTFQASSPDEIAIVEWTKKAGVQLIYRDKKELHLKRGNQTQVVKIIHTFPFTSDSKRMGVVVKINAEIWFYQKGADSVMKDIVKKNDWLEEECDNLAREGLRTLVIARKSLKPEEYEVFLNEYNEASLNMLSREVTIQNTIKKYLENEMEYLGITGVEDKLQADVTASLELLKNAGISIWMLTGDKSETAKCISLSSRLFKRTHIITTIENQKESIWSLMSSINSNTNLVIDGASIQYALDTDQARFFEATRKLPAVAVCRCSPRQKASVASALKMYIRNKRVCCIGDGGNDVGMIQEADVGVGLTGKEGVQASLAADFSISQFSHLPYLILWHGRNSYSNSRKLVFLIIHRGLLIAICQAVFSVVLGFAPIALYKGWLMVGFATIYTMMPIFSITLDKDVTQDIVLLYPELYKELANGKLKTLFALFVLVSIYQGLVTFLLTLILVEISNIERVVAISFTCLILTEMSLLASVVTKWYNLLDTELTIRNWTIAMTIVTSIMIYIISTPFLGEYFDLDYFKTREIYWKLAIIVASSVIPPWFVKYTDRKLNPPNYAKLQDF